MTGQLEEELLQDFLLESLEIVEGLDEQLVALERAPDDDELLNSIFRGFHTIKGGAGFLDIGPMVTLCHEAEELFNQLRRGEKQVNADLMDVSLAALDGVKSMFSALREGRDAPDAPAEVITKLKALAQATPSTGDGSIPPSPTTTTAAPKSTGKADSDFDSWLDEAAELDANDDAKGEEEPTPDITPDMIGEDEFESLLDQLHGPGGAPGAANQESAPPEAHALSNSPPGEARKPVSPPAAGGRRAESSAETSIRVDAHRLDDLMNLVGELVLARNRLLNLAGSREDHDLVNAVSALDHIASSLQDNIMRVRMQPIRRVFSRFPRVVRDLARQLGKRVDLILEGEDTELDKNLIEEIADPLVHLLRNAIDHGLETPVERARTGKPETGRVRLAASQEGDHIQLVIEDDGGGIDPERLKRSAIEKGLVTEEAALRLTDTEAYDLMFMPGFSTRQQVSDISGRGVGMDVVRTRIAGMNGTITIKSELGCGSSFMIALPLTLAILPTMMVRIDGVRYALPLNKVREIAELSTLPQHWVERQRSIVLRGETLPLVDLRMYLGHGTQEAEDGQVIVLAASNRELAVAVDEVLGQQDVVVKPLSSELSASAGISGSTITGDGSVALILDLEGMVRAILLEKMA